MLILKFLQRNPINGCSGEKIQLRENNFEFYTFIKKCNAEGARKLLERLNESADAGNCQVCMWILERCFPEDFARRQYRKMNIVSENKNENVEIIVQDTDAIRKEILAKFALG